MVMIDVMTKYYEVIKSILNYDGSFTHDLSKPAGMRQKLLDISKTREIGWEAKTSLEEGIKKTYEFYMETL